MFDSLKKSLGIKDKPQSTGYVLGTGKKEPSGEVNYQGEEVYRNDDMHSFDVTFHDEKLGMGVDEHRGLPVVSSVNPGSAAHKSGILVGDTVVALENNELSNFDSFFTFMQVIGRPVTITFQRRKSNQATVSSTVKNFMNSMPTISMPKVTSKPPPEELSEEEKQARRAMLSKAANERTQQWDKKLGANKINRAKSKETDVARNGSGLASDEDALRASNPETQRVIEKTKELELNVERSMGYNPFKPHMSFSGSAGTTCLPPAPSPSNSQPTTPHSPNTRSAAAAPPSAPVAAEAVLNSGNTIGLTQDEYDDFVAEMVSEVDDSFAMLLSLGQDQQEVAKVAVQTVQKMLLNLYNNKTDLKLRSIRVSNKVFQSKVATVPGGIEMLLAAGYVVVDKTATTDSSAAGGSAEEGSNSPKEASSSSSTSEGAVNDNLFLVHSMDAAGEKKLSYTLARIKELFDSTSI